MLALPPQNLLQRHRLVVLLVLCRNTSVSGPLPGMAAQFVKQVRTLDEFRAIPFAKFVPTFGSWPNHLRSSSKADLLHPEIDSGFLPADAARPDPVDENRNPSASPAPHTPVWS